MIKKNRAKAVIAVMLLGIVISGCKTQQPPVSDNQKESELQATVPDGTTPEQAEPDTTMLQLNLPEEFFDCAGNAYAESYDMLYSNGNMGVGVIRVSIPQGFTLQDYVNRDAEYYRSPLIQRDGFWTLTYEDLESNEPQTIVNVYYESKDAFWIVQGCCPTQSYPEYETQIWQYITGATFAG